MPNRHCISHTLGLTVILTALTTLGLTSAAASAAEKIVLKYGPFRESIAVAELVTFAETGEPSPTLNSYFRMAKTQPKTVRSALTKSVKVSPITLDRFLNHNLLGKVLINTVGEAIHTPTNSADAPALRSALMAAASDDDRISLIEAIQHYPTQEVQVEGDKLVAAYQQIKKLEKPLKSILESILG